MLKHIRNVSLLMAFLALAFVICLTCQPQSVSHARSLTVLDGSPSQQSTTDSPSQQDTTGSSSQQDTTGSSLQQIVGELFGQ